MRWYQAENTVMVDELYTEQTRLRLQDNPNILVNGKKYFLVEDRIGECAI